MEFRDEDVLVFHKSAAILAWVLLLVSMEIEDVSQVLGLEWRIVLLAAGS